MTTYLKNRIFKGEKAKKSTLLDFLRYRSASRVTKMERCASVTGALYPHLLRRFLKKRLQKSKNKNPKHGNRVNVSTALNRFYNR